MKYGKTEEDKIRQEVAMSKTTRSGVMKPEPGDEVTIIIKGKYRGVWGAYGQDALHLLLSSPYAQLAGMQPNNVVYQPSEPARFGYDIDLDKDASVTVEVVPRFKNGVYIDLADGAYWMRRPDGWYPMGVIEPRGQVTAHHQQVRPKNPQRLREAKDK